MHDVGYLPCLITKLKSSEVDDKTAVRMHPGIHSTEIDILGLSVHVAPALSFLPSTSKI